MDIDLSNLDISLECQIENFDNTFSSKLYIIWTCFEENSEFRLRIVNGRKCKENEQNDWKWEIYLVWNVVRPLTQPMHTFCYYWISDFVRNGWAELEWKYIIWSVSNHRSVSKAFLCSYHIKYLPIFYSLAFNLVITKNEKYWYDEWKYFWGDLMIKILYTVWQCS